MAAFFDLFTLAISLAIRVGIIIVATPFVLLWPREDKKIPYGQAIGSRFKKILGHAFM